jgi:phage anti-repressor protein
MDNIIVPKTINFDELVKNSNTTLSLNIQTKMIGILTEQFTEEEQKWYIANLYVYMNYHPTNDYPINLEHVFKMIGFANKGNAMKTIKNNFIKDEDYKVVFFPREKNLKTKDLGGRPEETIMLNVDTFKNLCMLVKTEKGKEIRKYYVKLENIGGILKYHLYHH